MNPRAWGSTPWPWRVPPTEAERERIAIARDRHHTIILRAFGIGCKSTHPETGIGCELEPHTGECAAVVNDRVVTWPGPEDRKARKRLNNTVNVTLRRFLETPAQRARRNEHSKHYQRARVAQRRAAGAA